MGICQRSQITVQKSVTCVSLLCLLITRWAVRMPFCSFCILRDFCCSETLSSSILRFFVVGPSSWVENFRRGSEEIWGSEEIRGSEYGLPLNGSSFMLCRRIWFSTCINRVLISSVKKLFWLLNKVHTRYRIWSGNNIPVSITVRRIILMGSIGWNTNETATDRNIIQQLC